MTSSDVSDTLPVASASDAAVKMHDIVVIGASAGAVPSLKVLVRGLPGNFPGSIFVTVHMSAEARSELSGILSRAGSLPVSAPADMTPIESGQIYVSSPDCHMLLERDRVRIVRGPKENRHRPAIDPLFRSAAWAYGPRVVGIVLTGYLDDGTAGLWAIKTCGGITIVQDPADALHLDMPQNALMHNRVDYCVPLDEMAALLVKLATEPVDLTRHHPRPASVKTEVEFASIERDRDIDDMGSLGRLSPFTCPSCRGALWELQEGDLMRYRCHTGHAFSEKSLLTEQSISIEEALYAALKAVEEKAAALRKLSQRWSERFPQMEADYQARVSELDASARVLRRLLANGTT